jgi:uncharacterized protein YggE
VVLLRTDDGEFREKAYANAVKKALRAAKAIADGAGVKIGDTIEIVESEEGDGNRVNGPYASREGREPAGELELTVRVKVKCSY